jgi:hypothetical protein
MAEEDEPTTSTGGQPDSEVRPTPGGTGRFWKGFTPVQQLALPLIALAVAVGVIAGSAGLMGGSDGGDEGGGGVSDPSEIDERPQRICEDALDRARRALRRQADPIAGMAKRARILQRAGTRMRDASSILGFALSEQAAALEALARAYRAGALVDVRRAEARLRVASAETASAARSEGADACVRLARVLGGRLRTTPG